MSESLNTDSAHESEVAIRPLASSSLPFVLAIVVAIGAAYGGFKWWQVQNWEATRGEAISSTAVGPPLKEFELAERNGDTFRSADMRGKVWVVTYFYASCPGQCIRLNQNIKLMHNLPELKDVTWVSITCDPDNDTLAVLKDYADRWQADPKRWLFCRADLPYIKRIGAGMNMSLFRQSHQDYAIVIDKAGKIRALFDGTSRADCEKLVTRLQECLEEPAPHDVVASGEKKASS
jgi:cytochrome oxidase Cu insertion factor (SCO1/SenC/PrrC family)